MVEHFPFKEGVIGSNPIRLTKTVRKDWQTLIIKFSHIGDKLVSVGENSIVDINDIVGKDSFVGFASKDGSTLKGNNINFNNVNIPFSSYIKKSEYDKAILKVNDVRYQNYLIPYLKDQYSLIEINNDNKKNINKEVIEIIYNKNIIALQIN